MRKSILFIVLFFALTLKIFTLENNSEISYFYSKEKHFSSFDFVNKYSKSFFTTKFFPEAEILNWGIKQQINNLTIQGGKQSLEGTKSKMTNPDWNSIDVLHIPKIPSLYSKANFSKTFSKSNNNSFFAEYKFPSINETLIFPTISFFWQPSFTEEKIDSSLYFTSIVLPFQFNQNKIKVSLNYGTNFINDESDSWFMETPYFFAERNSVFLEEFSFINPFFSLYSNFAQTKNPFGKITLFSRNELKFKARINKNFSFATEARLFASSFDFFCLDKKIIRTPLHFSIMNQFYIKTNQNLTTLSFLFDDKFSYSSGIEQNFCKSQSLQVGIKSEFDFLYCATKLKYFPYNFDKNELFFSFGAKILPTKKFKTKVNLFSDCTFRFFFEEFSFSTSSKLNFQKFYTQFSFKYLDNYDFSNHIANFKLKLGYDFFNADINIKKTASEDFHPETAIEFSTSVKLKF